MIRKVLILAVVILAAVVYYRTHHWAHPLTIPPGLDMTSRTPGLESRPAAPSVFTNESKPRPPGQIHSPELDRTMETLRDVNRINTLNQDQRLLPPSPSSEHDKAK